MISESDLLFITDDPSRPRTPSRRPTRTITTYTNRAAVPFDHLLEAVRFAVGVPLLEIREAGVTRGGGQAIWSSSSVGSTLVVDL